MLGHEFDKYLNSALTASAVFGVSALDYGEIPCILTGTYDKMGDQLRFHLRLEDKQGLLLSSAEFESPITDIPEELLTIMATEGKVNKVCLKYRPINSSAPKSDSPAASLLITQLGELLAEHGVNAQVCQGIPPKDSIRIEIIMQLSERSTGDGFKVTLGSVTLRISKPNGQIIGSVSKRGKTVLAEEMDNGAERIINKVLTSSMGEKLAMKILGRQ